MPETYENLAASVTAILTDLRAGIREEVRKEILVEMMNGPDVPVPTWVSVTDVEPDDYATCWVWDGREVGIAWMGAHGWVPILSTKHEMRGTDIRAWAKFAAPAGPNFGGGGE